MLTLVYTVKSEVGHIQLDILHSSSFSSSAVRVSASYLDYWKLKFKSHSVSDFFFRINNFITYF